MRKKERGMTNPLKWLGWLFSPIAKNGAFFVFMFVLGWLCCQLEIMPYYLRNRGAQPYKLTVVNCDQSSVGTECKNTLNDNTSFPNNYTLKIFRAATCDDGKAVQASNPRKIAVQYKMEGPGVHCANT